MPLHLHLSFLVSLFFRFVLIPVDNDCRSVLIKLYHYSKEIKLTPKTTSHADNETSESTPLLISPQTSSHSQATSQTNSHPSSRRHTPAFDMAIAQASLALEVVCFGLTPFAPSQPLFIALTVLAACGSGFGPAIQSLVVELYSRRGGTETGRLFGVLGVVQVIWYVHCIHDPKIHPTCCSMQLTSCY